MKVTVDKELCVGCGLCAGTCSAVYEMEGPIAVAKVDVVPSNEESCAQQGADECPVSAITVE
jgi:ferredoxin